MSLPQLSNQLEIERASNGLISPTRQRLKLNFGLFMLLVFGLATLLFYFAHTSRWEVSVDDFFIEWKGAQIALQGGDPYSDNTTHLIQIGLHRFDVPANEDQLAFVYPYWRVFYNAPIAFLPYAWAAALWLGFLLALFLGSVYLVTSAVGWRPKTLWQQAALYLSLLLAFPTFASTMLGQVALFDGALLAMVYYCLRTGSQGWAGIWLSLATVKPQLAALLVLWLLGRACWRREWRFIGTFGLTLSVLVLASFVAYPKWLSEFLQAINRYPGYKKSLTGPGFLFDNLGLVGTLLTALLWGGVAAVGLLIGWRESNKSARISAVPTLPGSFFDLSFCVALFLTLWLPPQTNIVNAVLLEVPIILLMARWSQAGKNLAFYLMAFANVLVSWSLYFMLYKDFYGWLIVGPLLIIATLFIFNFKSEFVALVRPTLKEKVHAV